jgi:1,4-alpha-glucan branching enzyme
MVSVTDGRCVFRLYRPHASSVELVGSFCGWKLDQKVGVVALEPDADGWWTGRMQLPEGDHEFCYLLDGHTWMPDYAAGGVRRDASGRWVSLLSIPASRREAEDRPIGALAEPRVGRAPEREPGRVLAHAS